MGHFLGLALSFPTVVFTVLLGVAFVYWMFVLAGVAKIGHATDVDVDADVDADADVDHDADHDADADAGSPGLLAALSLRKAPATIVFSAVILFSWLFTILGVVGLDLVTSGTIATIGKGSLLVLAPVVALFPTSLVVRPLNRLFTMPEAVAHEGLVGKVCTIRTGTVTDRFGEAAIEDGGAGVVVRVRIDTGEKKLERGQQALIVGYDEKTQEFTVAPMDEILQTEQEKKRVH